MLASKRGSVRVKYAARKLEKKFFIKTVGVNLVGMARYGARFVVLKHPLLIFSVIWLSSRLNVGSGAKISLRHVILYNTFSENIDGRKNEWGT